MKVKITTIHWMPKGKRVVMIDADISGTDEVSWMSNMLIQYDPHHANSKGHPDLKFLSPVDKEQLREQQKSNGSN